MKYLAHLRPPRDVSADIGSFRGAIQDTKTAPNVVHCTLMAGHFPDSAEEAILSQLERISQSYTSFLCEAQRLAHYDKQSVVVELTPKQDIRTLHGTVVNALLPYMDRTEYGQNCHACIGNSVQEAAHRTFGNCYYGPFYSPHITVGRAAPGENLDYIMGMFSNLFTGVQWPADEIWLSRKPNGKWETVQSFKLR